MIKRIKILLSVLVILCIFGVKDTYALSLNCDSQKYQCYVCEYKVDAKNNPTFEVRVYSDGYGTLSSKMGVDTSFPSSIGGYSINQTYNLITTASFKDGYSIKCPSSINLCLISMDDYDSSKMTNITSQKCYAGQIGYTASLSNSSTNRKPFFTKEQEEKVVGEDEKYGETGYDVPIILNNSTLDKTFHIDSKNQILNKEISKVNIDGDDYKIDTASGTVTNTTPYSSIQLICKSSWLSKRCWFKDSEKQERVATAATQDQYLDDMGDIFGNVDDPGSCDTLLDADAKQLILTIFNWIRIITPIILVVLGAIDFSRAMLASDDKQMAMAVRNFITRCVIALAIFFVPLIIYYFMDIIMRSTGMVDDAGNICRFL